MEIGCQVPPVPLLLMATRVFFPMITEALLQTVTGNGLEVCKSGRYVFYMTMYAMELLQRHRMLLSDHIQLR